MAKSTKILVLSKYGELFMLLSFIACHDNHLKIMWSLQNKLMYHLFISMLNYE